MTDSLGLRTLVFIVTPEQVLLGLKKNGFGVGKWNGFGGKVEIGETIAEAAARELEEEAGIVAHDLTPYGILSFTFGNGLAPLQVHVFQGSVWAGEIRESAEMAPRWFPREAIPYDRMWIDDSYWLPLLLDKKHFIGTFHLQDTETLVAWEVNEVAAERLLRHV